MKQETVINNDHQGQQLWEVLITQLTPELEAPLISEKFWLDYEQLIAQNKQIHTNNKRSVTKQSKYANQIAELYQKYWDNTEKIIKIESKIEFGWSVIAPFIGFLSGITAFFSSNGSITSIVAYIALFISVLIGITFLFVDEPVTKENHAITLKADHFLYELSTDKLYRKLQVFYDDIHTTKLYTSELKLSVNHLTILQNTAKKSVNKKHLFIPDNTNAFNRLRLFFEDVAKTNNRLPKLI